MTFSPDILTTDEKIILELRGLYTKHGYTCFKLSRFEEYGLYAENREFLPDGNIITFTDTGGKLMAMRPDVTLSIVKNIKDDGEMKKLCYNENVYRTIDGGLHEQMQVGLECIGDIDAAQTGEVLMLAKQSLDALGGSTRLDISHMGFISGLLGGTGLTPKQKAEVLQCISEKNTHGLRHICERGRLGEFYLDELTALTSLYGTFSDVIPELEKINVNSETDAALQELNELDEVLKNLGISEKINIDFSVVNNITYYGGIIFHGFIEGVPSMLLSGGRYDKLLKNFGKSGGAIGFAVYLNRVPQITGNLSNTAARNESGAADNNHKTDFLGVALPKGRLGEKALELFRKAGCNCPDLSDVNRKLVFEDTQRGIRFFWVKPSDVAVYVERGAADIGVVGKDTLLETRYDVYELLDLGLGKCRICVAGKSQQADGSNAADESRRNGKVLRVATKFPNIACDYYAHRGIDIDIIRLHGSIELAPLLGLSDVIVDLVETGQTLSENNMVPAETITEISARLIVNKSSYRFKHEKIEKLHREIIV